MDINTLEFRGNQFGANEHDFGVWLRLVALNLPWSRSDEQIVALREEWLDYSASISFCDIPLEELDGKIELIEAILKASAKVIALLEDRTDNLDTGMLTLMGIQHCCSSGDVKRILWIGNQFVSLFTQHADIVDQLVQKQECYQKPRLGPPCPYCGILLFHLEGKQCLECGWDWHIPDNPVEKKVSKKKVYTPACLVDKGNLFDRKGYVRWS